MAASIWERFEQRQGRWWLVVAVLSGVVLTLPSLDGGWVLDDCYHRWANIGSARYGEILPSKWDIFRFLDGDESRTGKMMDMGLFPWWTYKVARGAFWRPFAAATHILDYSLWPKRPALMHAQSILWYGGLIACAWLLYKRFMGPGLAAGLATLLFAIDDAHAVPVAMLANRNALVSALFGVLAICAHDKWRRDGWRSGWALGPVILAMSLFSAEAGIGVCAYLAAYEVTLGEGRWRRRLAALVPYAAVVVTWQILWRVRGYGVEGVLVYTDPAAHPLRFAGLVALRLPVLLLGQWGPLPAEAHLMLGARSIYWMALAGVIMAAVLAWALLPIFRTDRMARFWAIGMLLALVPACGMDPMNRQLIFAGIGAMGLLGLFLSRVRTAEPWQKWSGPGRAAVRSLAVIMILVHVAFAPAEFCLFSRYTLGPRHIVASYDRFPGMDSWMGQEDLIIVNHPIPDEVGHMVGRRDVEGKTLPRRIRTLASAWSPVTVQRIDGQTLLVQPQAGYLASISSGLMRDRYHPISAGEKVELSGVTITVGSLNADGRPAEATFHFSVPLEDASLLWVYWYKGAFKVFELPAVGQSVTIPAGGLPF
jgi:hypothetical protein